MSDIPKDVRYVLLNGRVWYRTYIPDVGERWTRYVKNDQITTAQLLRKGKVYPLSIADNPLNPDV